MTTKCLAIAAVLSLAAATRLTTAQAAALRDAPGDCVTDYKLCKDNSELVGNWEYQGKPGMTVRFLCLREAGRMGHKGLPPYAFSDIWTQVAMKGRDFVDTAVVRLTNHGMTCVVDLDAETVSVTADATADRPWCRDDYRVAPTITKCMTTTWLRTPTGRLKLRSIPLAKMKPSGAAMATKRTSLI